MFDLTTTNKTTVYTCPTDRTALIKSIQITNIHSGAVEVEAFTTDSSASNAEHEVAHISLSSKTIDNLVKGVMDSLFNEDSHVHTIYAKKIWSDNPGILFISKNYLCEYLKIE